MFGGQDDNVSTPPTGGGSGDDTLKGVDDLTASLNSSSSQTAAGTDSSRPMPSEPSAPSGPIAEQPSSDTASSTPSASTTGSDTDKDALLGIKQQALQQLTPLVGHLEQTPLEKFRTTMMLIQASDNQALLKDAYEAANAIEDEKIKAQALLDVVNEINYFTQPKE